MEVWHELAKNYQCPFLDGFHDVELRRESQSTICQVSVHRRLQFETYAALSHRAWFRSLVPGL